MIAYFQASSDVGPHKPVEGEDAPPPPNRTLLGIGWPSEVVLLGVAIWLIASSR